MPRASTKASEPGKLLNETGSGRGREKPEEAVVLGVLVPHPTYLDLLPQHAGL